MHLLGEIDCLKPRGERPLEIASECRRPIADPSLKFTTGCGVAGSTCDGRTTIRLNGFEENLTTLLTQHFTDEAAEHVDIVSQRRVALRELDFGPIHETSLHPRHRHKAKGRRDRSLRPLLSIDRD